MPYYIGGAVELVTHASLVWVRNDLFDAVVQVLLLFSFFIAALKKAKQVHVTILFFAVKEQNLKSSRNRPPKGACSNYLHNNYY